MKYIKYMNQFINEGIFNAHYRPGPDLINPIHNIFPNDADEIIYAMLSKDVDNALSTISKFIGGLGVSYLDNNDAVKYIDVGDNSRYTIIHDGTDYYCMSVEEYIQTDLTKSKNNEH